MLRSVRNLFAIAAVIVVTANAIAADTDHLSSYPARDSLGDLRDPSPDATACLQSLQWDRNMFMVDVRVDAADAQPRLVQFPSPMNTDNTLNDRVAMQWYVARDPQGVALRRPGMVVVHESGSAMPVGRLFAKTLSLYGVHAFLIHLPHYGLRRGDDASDAQGDIVQMMRQAITDVRRARDAVAVLPEVDPQHVSLQGTSLGGFVAALSGSMDHSFQDVFITLAGGDFYSLLTHGERDAAKMRQKLAEAGYSGEKLRQLVQQVEPLRVAHRLQPEHTWLFSGASDRVVPIANAQALADAANLPADHHVIVNANHYTAIAFFPTIIDQIVRSTLPGDLIPAEMRTK